MQQYHNEVTAKINNTAKVIPAHRKAFKQGYSFSGEPFRTQLGIWKYVWKNAGNFSTRLHAYFFLEQYATKKELLGEIWHTSVLWQEDIDGWGLCDALSKVNTKALEQHPEIVYEHLAEWNKSDNLWKRRQSVVSLLYYSRTKKVYLPFGKITALIIPLLSDKEYYVQKGVGWSLRELHNVYPAEAFVLLKKHIRDISAIAFTIAIEKLDSSEKEELKAMRKK